MKSSTPVLDSLNSSSFLLLHTRVLRSTIWAWAHQSVKFSHPSPDRHCYRNTASCKSVYHILSPGNSENDYTPVSRPSYEKCGTLAPNQTGYENVNSWQSSPEYSRRERLTGCYSQLTQKKLTEQDRGHKGSPSQLQPQLLPTGTDFIKPSYMLCLYSTLCGYPSTLIRVRAGSYAPCGQSTHKVPPSLGHAGHVHSAAAERQ